MKLYVGDLIFPAPSGFVGKGIAAVTRSNFSHVGMVYDKNWVFEAHIGKNTRLNPLKEHNGKKFRVLRPNLTTKEKHHLKKLMEEFNGTPYSTWDIFTNFTFSWLRPKARRGLVSKLGSKGMMICSELIGRMLFTVDSKKFAYFNQYGGLQPGDVFDLGMENGMREIKDSVEATPIVIHVEEPEKEDLIS